MVGEAKIHLIPTLPDRVLVGLGDPAFAFDSRPQKTGFFMDGCI
jgi:hypothetical protein